MPINTREALGNIDQNLSQGLNTASRLASNATNVGIDDLRSAATRSVSGALGGEITDINPNSIVNQVSSSIGNITDTIGNFAGSIGDLASNAAQSFAGAFSTNLDSVTDSLSNVPDQISGIPSPSSIQQTGSLPVGSTTPSLAGRQNQTFSSISPRPYFRIDPQDNRYDFLTGQKINSVDGSPNTNSPVNYQGGNTTGGTRAGAPGTGDFDIGFGEGQVNPAVASASGLEGNVAEAEAAGTTNLDPTAGPDDGLRGGTTPTESQLDTTDDARAARTNSSDPLTTADTTPAPVQQQPDLNAINQGEAIPLSEERARTRQASGRLTVGRRYSVNGKEYTAVNVRGVIRLQDDRTLFF